MATKDKTFLLHLRKLTKRTTKGQRVTVLDWAIEEGDKILSHAERMMSMVDKNKQCTHMEQERLTNNLYCTRGHSSWIPVLDVWQLVCNQNPLEMEDELDETQKLNTAMRQSMPLEDFENRKGKVCTEKRKRDEGTEHTPAYS